MAIQSVNLPRKIVAGPGAIAKIKDVCMDLGLEKKAFVVADSVTKDICEIGRAHV